MMFLLSNPKKNEESKIYRVRAKITDQKKIAPGHTIVTFQSRDIAKAARPGQFVQILCDDSSDPLLTRPFSFLRTRGDLIDILYHVVGRGTSVLSRKVKGESLWLLGPLGNGFSALLNRPLVLVGGGVGIPPLYHLAETLPKRDRHPISVFLGARRRELVLCEKEFRKLGCQVFVSTDDGSRGFKGRVTDLLRQKWAHLTHSKNDGKGKDPAMMYTCGPTPMLKAVCDFSLEHGVSCEAAVEVPMACGFGACVGCAVKVREAPFSQDVGRGFRYAMACSEGPVFQARDIIWEE